MTDEPQPAVMPPEDAGLGDTPAPAEPAPPTAPRRRTGRILGVAIGLAGLVGGGAFAFTQFTGREQANTPEEAIESLLHSFETGDAIGMAKLLAPGERDVMLDSMVPMVAELSRLEILDQDLDLGKVPGYEAKISDFKATSTLLRPDLAEVRVTGGRIRTSFDPKKLPLGDFVRDLAGDSLDDATTETSTSDLQMGSDDDPFILQKVGKRWYLSLNYSVAESTRRTAADPYPVPAKGAGVPAKGAKTAVAAVSEMITAAGHYDVRRMIELLPPDEFAAVHDYAGQFVDQAEDGVADLKDLLTIDLAPKLSATKLGKDRTLVRVVDLPFSVRYDDDDVDLRARYADRALSGTMRTADGTAVKAEYRDNCLTLTVDGDTKKGCGQKGIVEMFAELSGDDVDTSQLDETLGTDLWGGSCVTKRTKPTLGFVAVKRDGAWFVSPLRTSLDNITALLRQVERSDLDCVRTTIEDTVNSLNGTFGADATDSTFEAPLDPADDPFATEVPDPFADDTFAVEDEGDQDTLSFDTAPADAGSDSTG